jgi:hypothetical protein
MRVEAVVNKNAEIKQFLKQWPNIAEIQRCHSLVGRITGGVKVEIKT